MGAIISKALEKDRNARYQRAVDLRTDIQRLKQDTETAHVTGMAPGAAPPQVRAGRARAGNQA